MKKTLLSIVAVLLLHSSFAQEKGHFGFSLGVSAPVGKFASKDIEKSYSGFAGIGSFFEISLAHKLGKRFGIITSLRRQSNTIDTEALSDGMSKLYLKDGYNVRDNVTAGNWKLATLMVGGYESFYIPEHKVFIEPRVMIGLAYAVLPEKRENLQSNYGYGWIQQDRATDFTFAYLVGTGFKWIIGKKTYFLTNIDYLSAKAKFTNIVNRTSGGSVEITSYTQKMSTVNIGLGIGIKL
ncbi:hypothetical protein SAMN05421780_102435 [Flexibacter flexilis DSM 6793]|uniref:Uncharacterized protein n=1 Tax=Flexibacter flexilis DSM 6793 TaxID=927664 RepID=A0A1I1G458_9BACT|nr:outer membrane beta-barrel protein [Flexibacter flexilis]SFC06092.1 hypothetical protein SAMN05421780_102435 [Flexibacter flexilis DSM 6793]